MRRNIKNVEKFNSSIEIISLKDFPNKEIEANKIEELKNKLEKEKNKSEEEKNKLEKEKN